METKGIELKPCPFCGSKNLAVDETMYVDGSIYCEDCGASGPLCDTQEDEIKSWNRRYELPDEPLTLDELLQMDEEPVWVCDCDRSHGCYMLVSTRSSGCVNCDEIAEFNDYGIEWLAYRRRPEEE